MKQWLNRFLLSTVQPCNKNWKGECIALSGVGMANPTRTVFISHPNLTSSCPVNHPAYQLSFFQIKPSWLKQYVVESWLQLITTTHPGGRLDNHAPDFLPRKSRALDTSPGERRRYRRHLNVCHRHMVCQMPTNPACWTTFTPQQYFYVWRATVGRVAKRIFGGVYIDGLAFGTPLWLRHQFRENNVPTRARRSIYNQFIRRTGT